MELDIKFDEKDMRIVQGAFAKLVQLGKSDGITRKMATPSVRWVTAILPCISIKTASISPLTTSTSFS